MLNALFYTGPSLAILHSEYAKKGRIDTKAPVQSSCQIDIKAPVDVVWKLLSDLSGWETWYPGVKNVHVDSEVAVDAAFSWKNGAGIKSTFAVVESEKELTWTGISAGAKAVDRHVLQAIDGGTRVMTEESIAGPLLGIFFTSQKLLAGQQKMLQALKQAAEKQATHKPVLNA